MSKVEELIEKVLSEANINLDLSSLEKGLQKTISSLLQDVDGRDDGAITKSEIETYVVDSTPVMQLVTATVINSIKKAGYKVK